MPDVRFLGRTTLTAHGTSRFQPGTSVALVSLRRNNPSDYDEPGKFNVTFKTVASIAPHQGQMDSFGKQVPSDVPEENDYADRVNFTDGTSALLGSYSRNGRNGESFLTPVPDTNYLSTGGFKMNVLNEARYRHPEETTYMMPLNVAETLLSETVNHFRRKTAHLLNEVRVSRDNFAALGRNLATAVDRLAGLLGTKEASPTK